MAEKESKSNVAPRAVSSESITDPASGAQVQTTSVYDDSRDADSGLGESGFYDPAKDSPTVSSRHEARGYSDFTPDAADAMRKRWDEEASTADERARKAASMSDAELRAARAKGEL